MSEGLHRWANRRSPPTLDENQPDMPDPMPGPDTVDATATDEELARRAAGDQWAFAVLYRRWAEPVYRYCYRRLLSREAAEDVTSQVMTQAFTSIDRFHGNSFPAWLFTIAHNAIVSTVRRPSWRLTGPLADDLPLVDPSPGPEELALAGETSRRLYAALAVLTPEQRQVIELRLADLTTVEIARVIGRQQEAVRMLQHRAIRRLRTQLAPPTDSRSCPDPKESSRV